MDILETERLIIRPFVMEDLEGAYRLLDVDLEWAGPLFSIDQRKMRLQLYIGLSQWEETGRLFGNRAILLKPSRELIGICGFHPDLWSPAWKATFWPGLFGSAFDPMLAATASLELGISYALSGEHRGQGYASEAVHTFLEYAFRELCVGRVFATTSRSNSPAIRVMERVGMRTAYHSDPHIDYPGVVGVVENG